MPKDTDGQTRVDSVLVFVLVVQDSPRMTQFKLGLACCTITVGTHPTHAPRHCPGGHSFTDYREKRLAFAPLLRLQASDLTASAPLPPSRCLVVATGLYASPVGTVYRALQRKAPGMISLPFVMVAAVNGMLWSLFGLLKEDPWVSDVQMGGSPA